MTKPTVKQAPVRDELIEEVRAIRADISARFGNDVNQLCDHLKEVEKQYSKRVVRHPTRRAG